MDWADRVKLPVPVFVVVSAVLTEQLPTGVEGKEIGEAGVMVSMELVGLLVSSNAPIEGALVLTVPTISVVGTQGLNPGDAAQEVVPVPTPLEPCLIW